MVAAVQGEVVGAASTGKMIVPPVEAAQWVHTQIERGQSIRKLRLRYAEDLEKARAKKAEWVSQTHELLKGMFDTEAVAQEFMTWEARVLPDFAELHLFIEAFYDEMEQRLRKLSAIYRRIPVGRQSPHRASSPRMTRDLITAPSSSSETPAAATPASPATMESAESAQSTCIVFTHGDCTPEAADRVDHFIECLGLTVCRAEFGPAALECLDSADDVAFAIVLAPSAQRVADEGRALFQLGCCVGKVGAARVCVLTAEGSAGEVCSVPSVALDPADGWQLQLARQMKRSGVELDLNRIC